MDYLLFHFFLLFVCVFLCVDINVVNGCAFAAKGRKNPHLVNIPNRSLADIPSPLLDPFGCGRERNAPASMVCDPVKVFAIEEGDDIDSMVLNTIMVTGISVSVVVIHKMVITDYESNEAAAAAYASELHDRYNLGHLGMLIFLSMTEKRIIFHRPDILKEIVTDDMTAEILRDIDPFLAQGLLGDALEKAVYLLQPFTDYVEIKNKIRDAQPYLLEEIKQQVIDRVSGADAEKEVERKRRSEESRKRAAEADDDNDDNDDNENVNIDSANPIVDNETVMDDISDNELEDRLANVAAATGVTSEPDL